MIFLEFGILVLLNFILRFFWGVDILNAKGAKFFMIIENVLKFVKAICSAIFIARRFRRFC